MSQDLPGLSNRFRGQRRVVKNQKSLFRSLQFLLKLISMEVNTQILELIFGLKKITNISYLMSRKVKQYTIHEKSVIHTSKKEINIIASRLNKRCSNQQPTASQEGEGGSERWYWGEQKLFVWTVIYYAQALYIETNAIDFQQFSLILQLFPLKSQQFLRYEFISTFHAQNMFWASQEIDLLTTIASDSLYQNQWKKISYQMFIQSEGRFFKSRQSCRNRWFNHINPTINKNEWTNEEDFQMVSNVLKLGTKWAFIAREIESGRNQHMVKNRFRSLLRKVKISEKAPVSEACRKIIRFLKQGRSEIEENRQKDSIEARSNTQSQAKGDNRIKIKLESQTQRINPQVPTEQSQPFLIQDPKANELLSIDEIFTVLNKSSCFQNPPYLESFDSWLERIIKNQEDSQTISSVLY